MDEIKELRWPERGQTLFRGDLPDWVMNACLNFDPEPWTGISHGYRLAGGLLVEHVAKDRGDADFLVYPIVYLYRHHLELALKYLIRLANRLLGRPVQHSNEHDLSKLWPEARSLLEQLYPGEETGEAASALRVEYPIALDAHYGVWRAFGNRYWPAVYIADAEGRIRQHHFGEGEYGRATATHNYGDPWKEQRYWND